MCSPGLREMQEHRTRDEDHQAALRIRIVLKKAERDYEKPLVGNSDGAPTPTLDTDDTVMHSRNLRSRDVTSVDGY